MEKKQEETKVVEFNGMVESLKRLGLLTNKLNGLRVNILSNLDRNYLLDNLIQYCASLESYYLEIIGELSTDEMDEIEDTCLKPIRILLNIPNLNRTLILNKISPAEKILRLAAKKHGFITRNIVKDSYQTMS